MTQLAKRFGSRDVLRELTLEVQRGEFLVMAGPSGCGKTTTLRLIAGLERPTSGGLEIGGQEVSQTPPWRRHVAMVFQSQALYPHLSVSENLRFGLRRLGWSQREQLQRISEVADRLAISSLLQRRIVELSGGERQRVAVGRAIARPAEIYLLDEPLSSLDPPLREQLRSELTELQRALQATFLYVTHDPHEALALGDRLALLQDGRLQQLGPAMELYRHPVNRFVAEFLGTPRMTLSRAVLEEKDKQWLLKIGGKRYSLPLFLFENLPAADGTEVLWGVRPEDFHCSTAERDESAPHPPVSSECSTWQLKGRVTRVQNHGSQVQVTVTLGENPAQMVMPATDRPPEVGDLLPLHVNPEQLYLFDPRTGQSLGSGRRA
jgi:ABC-type sugar transport system ATPase subunit